MNLLEGTWKDIRQSAELLSQKEPFLTDVLQEQVLQHQTMASSLAWILSHQLLAGDHHAQAYFDMFGSVLQEQGDIVEAACCDLAATFERDPAIHDLLTIFLNIKGFMAIQCHRIAHYFWLQGRVELAQSLQAKNSIRFAVDIHPAARLGRYLMFDHGTGIVIGETCVIEDRVSILQNVTLGGSGKESGDRHPKIRQGVMIGASACILGNVNIGQDAKVGAGSVVLKDVPAFSTVVGVPAKVVRNACHDEPCPSEAMNQHIYS